MNASRSCECARLQAEKDEADGREAERAGIENVLKMEETFSRAADIGVAPEGEELAQLSEHLGAWLSSEYHIRNSYLHDRVNVFLARNGRARDLLEQRGLLSPPEKHANGVEWVFWAEEPKADGNR